MTTPPITAIEILSPTQSIEEIKDKIFDIYFPAGVQSVWLVIPMLSSVHVFTPDRKVVAYRNSETLKDSVTGIEVILSDFLPQ